MIAGDSHKTMPNPKTLGNSIFYRAPPARRIGSRKPRVSYELFFLFQQEHADLVQSASSTTPATQKMDQGIRNTEAMPIQHRCKKN
jgi:hypothetical protein